MTMWRGFPAASRELELPGPLQLPRHRPGGRGLRGLRDPDATGLDDADGAED
ncbi:hypothetical protein ABZ078_31220 [Streptomyces sp. NPDC006385]|uniref:hypothetical protein n=1 Tax=Streptomyces sp. NPDC006385 TaxID=3156761 RepID=UPI00339FC789